MRTPRVYFDMCALKRGWDDQTQLRIRLETDAVDLLLQLVSFGRRTFLHSAVHDAENALNRDRDRRASIEELLAVHPHQPMNLDVFSSEATRWKRLGLGATDASHAAAAVSLGADILLTVDDRFMHRLNRAQAGIRAVSPIQLASEVV